MTVMDFPLFVLGLSFAVLMLAAEIGNTVRIRVRALGEEDQDDFRIVLGATLTMLGLLVGFSFSMGVSRYDLRKTYEEAEANAIGTEYLRADLLPAGDAARLRALLRTYVEQRIFFYSARDPQALEKIDADTAELQNRLWATVRAAAAEPTPVVALAVSGMNDVLNSQGYTQAAWWNRIPRAAWALMVTIAVCCNLLIGYGARRTDRRIFLILPIAVSIAFSLISDMDSPRGGAIRVVPQNLLSLEESWKSR